jgi:hypothetical protein
MITIPLRKAQGDTPPTLLPKNVSKSTHRACLFDIKMIFFSKAYKYAKNLSDF